MSVTDPWWEGRNAEKERKRRRRRCFPFQINLALPSSSSPPHGLHCLCGMCTYTCTHSRQDTSKWGGGLRKRPPSSPSRRQMHTNARERNAPQTGMSKEATKVQGTKEKNKALLDRTNRTRMGGVVGAATVIVQRRRNRTFPSPSFFGVSFGLGGLTPEA